MKLSIELVKEHGNLDKERIILKALENIDIGNYMIADTTYIDEDQVSNKLRHTFWLPDVKVNKGDLIVVYTKVGNESIKKNKSGNKTYFFYWELGRSIWNKDKDAAAIFLVHNWISKKV